MRINKVVLPIVIAASIIGLSGCASSGATESGTLVKNSDSTNDSDYLSLVYEATGTVADNVDDARIIIAGVPDVADSKVDTTSLLPWKQTTGMADPATTTISMKVESLSSKSDAKVTCEVSFRGESIVNEASGPGAIAVCEGKFSAPEQY